MNGKRTGRAGKGLLGCLPRPRSASLARTRRNALAGTSVGRRSPTGSSHHRRCFPPDSAGKDGGCLRSPGQVAPAPVRISGRIHKITTGVLNGIYRPCDWEVWMKVHPAAATASEATVAAPWNAVAYWASGSSVLARPHDSGLADRNDMGRDMTPASSVNPPPYPGTNRKGCDVLFKTRRAAPFYRSEAINSGGEPLAEALPDGALVGNGLCRFSVRHGNIRPRS